MRKLLILFDALSFSLSIVFITRCAIEKNYNEMIAWMCVCLWIIRVQLAKID